jgi:nitrate reductase delta subunit
MCTATRATAARHGRPGQTYEQAGLFLRRGELPDHLPVVLEYASTQPPRRGAAFLGEMAHILNVIFSALLKRNSPTPACWRAARPGRREGAGRQDPRRAALDESWAEPMAFDGCSTQGQAGPHSRNPIQIVKPCAPPRQGVHRQERHA